MKKTISIIAILLLLVSCQHGNINGGRYYGTFTNASNNMTKAGNISFTYGTLRKAATFFMNDLIPMTNTGRNLFKTDTITVDTGLEDLLETMPAIDSIKVCDSTQTIKSLFVIAEFQGNSVKTNLFFTRSDDNKVTVDFVGYYE